MRKTRKYWADLLWISQFVISPLFDASPPPEKNRQNMHKYAAYIPQGLFAIFTLIDSTTVWYVARVCYHPPHIPQSFATNKQLDRMNSRWTFSDAAICCLGPGSPLQPIPSPPQMAQAGTNCNCNSRQRRGGYKLAPTKINVKKHKKMCCIRHRDCNFIEVQFSYA